MTTKGKFTVTKLKKTFRESLKDRGVKLSFARENNVMTFSSINDNKVLFTIAPQINKENSEIIIKFSNSYILNVKMFGYTIDYLVQYAQLEDVKHITFDFKSEMHYITDIVQIKMTHALFNVMGFKLDSSGIYVYKGTVNNHFNLRFLLETVESKLQNFQDNYHSSFEYKLSIPNLLINLETPIHVDEIFATYRINWYGYAGYIGLAWKDNSFYLQSVCPIPTHDTVSINFKTIPFTLDNFNEVFMEFIEEIPNQMQHHNLKHPPTHQLYENFYYFFHSNTHVFEEIMFAFKDVGYSFIEIENELAKMKLDKSYYNKKTIETPYYYLSRKHVVRDKVLKVHSHYLILMTLLQTNHFVYKIVKSDTEIEPAVLELEQELLEGLSNKQN